MQSRSIHIKMYSVAGVKGCHSKFSMVDTLLTSDTLGSPNFKQHTHQTVNIMHI